MGKTMTIAGREYVAAVRTKAFIISVVLMPVLMGGSILVQGMMRDKRDVNDQRFAVLDRSGQFGDFLKDKVSAYNETGVYRTDQETGEKTQVRPRYQIELIEPDEDGIAEQRLTLSGRVRNKELQAFIEIGADVVDPRTPEGAATIPDSERVRYYAENAALDDLKDWIAPVINERLRNLRIAKTQVDSEALAYVIKYMPIEALGLATRDAATGEVKEAIKSNPMLAIFVPMGVMMMMFMLVMMGAAPLVNSVLEEKMQRIAEVLLGSVTPFQLMMGKLLGTVGVSLTVLGVYVIGAGVAIDRGGYGDFVPYEVLPWFLAYQIGAILMFGALFVALGSACNDMKEAQSLMMPVWMLLMVPMFVWLQVVKEPLSGFATGLSLVPPWTPMLMVIRQSTPVQIPAWQPWAGLAGVILVTLLCVFIAGRIFRVGILLQGNPPKVLDMLRWAVRG